MTDAAGPIPETMRAWQLTGHGDRDRLVLADLPVPRPGPGEVLIRTGAAALNNTDVNTRLGWYSKSVRGATGEGGLDDAGAGDGDGAWDGGAIAFPRIQGADCCGRVVAVGEGVDPGRIGRRVLVRALQIAGAARAAEGRGERRDPFATWTFGSECDGAFAEYALTFAEETVPAPEGWTDVEAASLPCAYGTAENMIQRAGIGGEPGERVLVTGASGGVGAAAVQLLVRRGARVVAQCGADKADAVRALGATEAIGRDDPLDGGTFGGVVDLVAGPRWPALLDALRRGGRYVTAGAIAGPIVELDVRTLYLRDLTLYGSTFQPRSILRDVVGYAARGEIAPAVSAIYPFEALKEAQAEFERKRHVGKIVLRVGA